MEKVNTISTGRIPKKRDIASILLNTDIGFALEKEVLERMITTSFVLVVETPSNSANGSER